MKLPIRLNSIASLIDEGTNLYDIGCDHALLDIYLTLNNKNNCVAADINENALKNAIDNINKYNLNDKIEVVVSDGLKNINLKDNNTVVISGMGATTIINIIKNSNYKKIYNLIIQSNNDLYLIRKKITKLGFYIEDEINIKDRNKYYTIIKFKKGNKKYKYYEYLYGINLNNKEYIKYLVNKKRDIIKKIPNKRVLKKIKLYKEILYLKKHY